MKYPRKSRGAKFPGNYRVSMLGWSLSARIGWYTGPRRPDGCRDWMSGTGRRGYGHIKVNNATRVVSRLLLGLQKGDPRVAMHICDRPSCVEPSHLRIGTPSENAIDRDNKRRGSQSGRVTCLRGHVFDEKNTHIALVNGRPRRRCRRCDADKAIESYHRNKTELARYAGAP